MVDPDDSSEPSGLIYWIPVNKNSSQVQGSLMVEISELMSLVPDDLSRDKVEQPRSQADAIAAALDSVSDELRWHLLNICPIWNDSVI